MSISALYKLRPSGWFLCALCNCQAELGAGMFAGR